MENGAFFFGVVHKKNEQANDEHNVQSHFFFYNSFETKFYIIFGI